VTLTFSTCPPIYAAIPNQWLWLNGAHGGYLSTRYGTGEPVYVTGGTCKPSATGGTIIIQTATTDRSTFWPHDSGFTLTGGVNAAIEDNSEDSTVDKAAATLSTASGTAGDTFGYFLQVDNDQGASLNGFHSLGYPLLCKNVATMSAPTSFCGAWVYGPGDYGSFAGVVSITNSDLSLQCSGNAVTWYSGNDIWISNSIIQSYDQWGVMLGKPGGGYGTAHLSGDHFEIGGCTNNLDPALGIAGLVTEYRTVTSLATPVGYVAQYPEVSFPSVASQNLTVWWLYSVTSAGSLSEPIPIAITNITDPSVSGDNVDVKWYSVPSDSPGTSSWTIARTSVPSMGPMSSQYVDPPLPPGNGLSVSGVVVASGLTPASVCNVYGVCSFIDNKAPSSLGSLTPPDYLNGTAPYLPALQFAGNGLVIRSSDSAANPETSGYGGLYSGSGACYTTFAHAFENSIYFSDDFTGSGYFCNSPLRAAMAVWQDPLQLGVGGALAGIFLDNTLTGSGGGSAYSAMTGRINFGSGNPAGPLDAITFYDSNPENTSNRTAGGSYNKTSVAGRRLWSVNDIGVGNDFFTSSGGAQMFLRANSAFNFYVNNLPDNANWKLQIGQTAITAKEAVNISSLGTFSLGGGTSLSEMKTYAVSLAPPAIPAMTCSDQTPAVTGLSATDLISQVTPPGAYGQYITMVAYPSAAGVITFHFCNIATSSQTPPMGNYSFWAVH
jgi:hypothetical protein